MKNPNVVLKCHKYNLLLPLVKRPFDTGATENRISGIASLNLGKPLEIV